jgi:replicative superfamily II helicase
MINTVEKVYNPYSNSFENYKIIYDNGEISTVPLDEANSDYQAIMEYIENGGEVIDNGGNE